MREAAHHIVELSHADPEIVELLHVFGNELDILAHYESGIEQNLESKRSLLKRALTAAAAATRNEIGRG